MERINFKHSVIFFNLCILISPFYLMLNFEPIILCLFLILILGISHGALDNIKGKKLLKMFGYKSTISFYLAYILISLLIIIFWIIFPNVVLFLFLVVAAYHFGKEDTVFSFKRKFLISECLFFFKGSSVIMAPLLLQRNTTNEIFRILNFNGIMIMDFSSLIILNFFLTPILAFTLYFCFLHSIRHSITLIFELDKSFKSGLKKFINRAIPLTFATGVIFLFAIFFLNNFYKLDEAIYKVIFIGLASLTFPHILLEYLLEKNEKRT